MADIELVIKIPEWKYKSICEGVEASKRCGVVGIDPDIHEAIYNGTPLPKEHGRLGDLDALEEEMEGGINAGLMIDGYEDYSHINDTEDCLECVKYADALLEANRFAPVKEKSKSRDDDWER